MAIPQITAEEFAAYTQRQASQIGQTAKATPIKQPSQQSQLLQRRPAFHILISLIEVWTPEDVFKPMDAPKEKPLIFAECESINIQENYTGLVEIVTIRSPRGSTYTK